MTKKIVLIILLVVIAGIAIRMYWKYPHGKPSTLPVDVQNQNEYDKLHKGKTSYTMTETNAPAENQVFGKLLTVDYSRISVEKLKSYKCWNGWREHASENLSTADTDKAYNADNLPWCEDNEKVYTEDTGEGFTFDLTDKTKFSIKNSDGTATASTRGDFLADASLNKKMYPRLLVTFDGKAATSVVLIAQK